MLTVMAPSELDLVRFVETITAFRAELRWIQRILRFPAALITSVKGGIGGFGLTAFLAEFPLIDLAAGTSPTFSRPLFSALGAKLPGVPCMAAFWAYPG
jgi:hypothetical protein